MLVFLLEMEEDYGLGWVVTCVFWWKKKVFGDLCVVEIEEN